MSDEEKVEEEPKPEGIPGGYGGTITPWHRGQSGNPAGSRPGRRRTSLAVSMLFDAVENEKTALAIVASYLNIVMNAKSESLRFAAQQDLFDRVGLPKMATDREGQANAMASIVQIIRTGSPELGV